MELPNTIPLSPLRQIVNWITRPYDFLDDCIQSYGDIFTMKLVGLPPLVFISDPQIIKEIFATDSKNFDAGKSNNLLIPLLGNNSVILLDGDRHKRERKLLMPPFHGEKVKSYGETICQVTKEVGDRWQPNQSFLASQAMQDITLEVILQAVFGLREGERYQRLKPLLGSLLDLTGSPLRSSFLFFPVLQQDLGSWSPWGKVVRQRKEIYELLQAEIDERRYRSITGNDVLSLMLLARDEDGQPMTDAELKDELMGVLVAGHETSATVLSWALYWIHKLPAVKTKLLEELDNLGENPDSMAIASLPYLTAVVNESLRIYPILPITFPRIAKQEVKLNGHIFPEGTSLVPCIYTLHQREDIYPEPKKFKPERFLERQCLGERSLASYADAGSHRFSASEFIPFGGGNRRCLGYALAMLELKLVLATILTNYQLKLADDRAVKPRRRGLTVATSNGVPLVVVGNR